VRKGGRKLPPEEIAESDLILAARRRNDERSQGTVRPAKA